MLGGPMVLIAVPRPGKALFGFSLFALRQKNRSELLWQIANGEELISSMVNAFYTS